MEDELHRTLEDYLIDMETRPTDSGPSEDVWTLLQQKENDLLLAAELGKALLEKNEELKKQNEKLIEDYSTRVEVSAKSFYYEYTPHTANHRFVISLGLYMKSFV